MKFITILTTILLQSARASKQNAFDTELLAAMEFLPSEDVTRPGTLTVYDTNEGNMHVVANDENFGPASDGELLVVNNDINSDVAKDENFLPPLAEIKYFQIHSLYEVDGTQVCLQPRSRNQGSTIVVKPCLDDSSKSLQWWTVDEVGQFRNKANSDLCMTHAPESKLKLKQCLERDSTTKLATSFFKYNIFTNQIHFTRNPLRIVTVPNNLEESNIVLLVKPNTGNGRVAALVEYKVTKWAVKFL